jgi:response regulator of citrate/malate metabolism
MSAPEQTVLIVDDDFMVAHIHAKFVERTPGFRVIGAAHNGADALRLAAENQPDVILLDVHLPDQSGLDVLAGLRSRGHLASVIMVTAEREAQAVRTAAAHGATAYLVKPFEYAAFAHKLRQAASMRDALAAEQPDQATIDRAFGAVPAADAPLPKGLSTETATIMANTLRSHGECSASDAAEHVGISRVSARRYLEHFVATGQASVHLNYATSGRPERRYQWRE